MLNKLSKVLLSILELHFHLLYWEFCSRYNSFFFYPYILTEGGLQNGLNYSAFDIFHQFSAFLFHFEMLVFYLRLNFICLRYSAVNGKKLSQMIGLHLTLNS
jgi:hypothetical protein